MGSAREDRVRFANEELFVAGRLEVVEQVFSSDYLVHAGGKQHGGHAFIKKFVKLLRASIADLQVKQIEILAETGERLVWQRTLAGTHESAMKGIPASGKKIEWRDLMVSRFEGDKIVEEWTVSELAGELLLKQPRA